MEHITGTPTNTSHGSGVENPLFAKDSGLPTNHLAASMLVSQSPISRATVTHSIYSAVCAFSCCYLLKLFGTTVRDGSCTIAGFMMVHVQSPRSLHKGSLRCVRCAVPTSSGEGTVSLNEWRVLGQLWSEFARAHSVGLRPVGCPWLGLIPLKGKGTYRSVLS